MIYHVLAVGFPGVSIVKETNDAEPKKKKSRYEVICFLYIAKPNTDGTPSLLVLLLFLSDVNSIVQKHITDLLRSLSFWPHAGSYIYVIFPQ